MNETNKITIVIVDDHQMFLDGMISVLSTVENFEVLFVETNPKNVLNKLKYTLPDLIITDISMPEMNGLEFIKILNVEYPQVKIIALSMFDNLQTFEGLDGYLLKETDKHELIKTINAVVLKNEKCFLGEKNLNNTFTFKNTILTTREKDIITLISQEKTIDEIALLLNLSKATIETHKKNIFLKLQVKNVAGLIKRAIYLGVIK